MSDLHHTTFLCILYFALCDIKGKALHAPNIRAGRESLCLFTHNPGSLVQNDRYSVYCQNWPTSRWQIMNYHSYRNEKQNGLWTMSFNSIQWRKCVYQCKTEVQTETHEHSSADQHIKCFNRSEIFKLLVLLLLRFSSLIQHLKGISSNTRPQMTSTRMAMASLIHATCLIPCKEKADDS